MNPDGSGVVNLTNTPTESESQPAWSPDGRFIAFLRDGDIYWMRANGTGLTRLSAAVAAQARPRLVAGQ